MKESIILTVCDREYPILMNTLMWLARDPLESAEIIVINDGSTIDYKPLLGGLEKHMPIRWIDMEPYEACRIPNGPPGSGAEATFNNPAKAFNCGLWHARGEDLLILSSDVIVPPRVMERSRTFSDDNVVYCPMVIDLGTGGEYCGPHRVFPMPWFLRMKRETAVAAGGWDENYLMGMCFEDNDFLGRVALSVDGIVCDWQCVVWHQSHHQPAYEDGVWVQAANKRNEKYTRDKWEGGIPFYPEKDSPVIEQDHTRHETGALMLVHKDYQNLKEKVIQRTLSPFVASADAETLGEQHGIA